MFNARFICCIGFAIICAAQKEPIKIDCTKPENNGALLIYGYWWKACENGKLVRKHCTDELGGDFICVPHFRVQNTVNTRYYESDFVTRTIMLSAYDGNFADCNGVRALKSDGFTGSQYRTGCFTNATLPAAKKENPKEKLCGFKQHPRVYYFPRETSDNSRLFLCINGELEVQECQSGSKCVLTENAVKALKSAGLWEKFEQTKGSFCEKIRHHQFMTKIRLTECSKVEPAYPSASRIKVDTIPEKQETKDHMNRVQMKPQQVTTQIPKKTVTMSTTQTKAKPVTQMQHKPETQKINNDHGSNDIPNGSSNNIDKDELEMNSAEFYEYYEMAVDESEESGESTSSEEFWYSARADSATTADENGRKEDNEIFGSSVEDVYFNNHRKSFKESEETDSSDSESVEEVVSLSSEEDPDLTKEKFHEIEKLPADVVQYVGGYDGLTKVRSCKTGVFLNDIWFGKTNNGKQMPLKCVVDSRNDKCLSFPVIEEMFLDYSSFSGWDDDKFKKRFSGYKSSNPTAYWKILNNKLEKTNLLFYLVKHFLPSISKTKKIVRIEIHDIEVVASPAQICKAALELAPFTDEFIKKKLDVCNGPNSAKIF